MWGNLKLDNSVLKLSEDVTLWKTHKGLVEIRKSALTVAVRQGGERKGAVFQGQARLVLDTIVETENGAIGKSIERRVDKPFLMLGNPGEAEQHFVTATIEDLRKMGYEGSQQFVDEAAKQFDRFLGRRVNFVHGFHSQTDGLIFAFLNKNDDLDILIQEGSKLIYKSANTVFVSDGKREILKSPTQVVLSSHRTPCTMKT